MNDTLPPPPPRLSTSSPHPPAPAIEPLTVTGEELLKKTLPALPAAAALYCALSPTKLPPWPPWVQTWSVGTGAVATKPVAPAWVMAPSLEKVRSPDEVPALGALLVGWLPSAPAYSKVSTTL